MSTQPQLRRTYGRRSKLCTSNADLFLPRRTLTSPRNAEHGLPAATQTRHLPRSAA
jgi:hypothetical protein